MQGVNIDQDREMLKNEEGAVELVEVGRSACHT